MEKTLRNDLLGILGLPEQVGVYITDRGKEMGVQLPRRAFGSDSAYDLFSYLDVEIEPGDFGRFPMGLMFELPVFPSDTPFRIGMEIINRTGMGRDGVFAAAIIYDGGFRPIGMDGDRLVVNPEGWTCLLRNVSNKKVLVPRTKAFAQGAFRLYWTPPIVEIGVTEVRMDTDRGGGNFGSTDKK